MIFDSLTASDHNASSKPERLFLVVPHYHHSTDIPLMGHLEPPCEVVTDLWAERCLLQKRFFDPNDHVLSRPFAVSPIPGFEKLIVNSTGIADVDLLQVTRVVKLLGAEYDQVLKTGISVLLCHPSKASEDKLRHALKWRVPAVSIEWLWSCISNGKMQPFGAFSLRRGPNEQRPRSIMPDPKANATARKHASMKNGDSEGFAREGSPVELALPSKRAFHRDCLASGGDRGRTSKATKTNMTLGEGFLKSPQPGKKDDETRNNRKVVPKETRETAKDDGSEDHTIDDRAEINAGLPLQEVSTNSPVKAEIVPSSRKPRLFRHFDGHSSLTAADQEDNSLLAPNATSTAKTIYIPPQPESINCAIQELLSKSRVKNMTPAGSTGGNKKKRLLGRAVSNMSNSSREGSNVRASRASSIDSVNTDGLGSVILDETSQSKRINSSGQHRRSSFTGRASASERSLEEPFLEPIDAALYREEYLEDEEPPQMTQLGYDNPEDAVAFREMLAERRRTRSRKGQEDGMSSVSKEGKRIKDDVTVSVAGWGSGRRTRQKIRSP